MHIPRISPLHLYAGFLTLALPASLMIGRPAAHQDDQRQRFTEIDVERINIVEPDGTVKLVIANQHRQAATTLGGEVILPDRTRPPGMIFFDERGDEMGGLVFTGDESSRSGGLFFDQIRQDQVIGLMFNESQRGDQHRVQAGISAWDRPPDVSILDAIRMMEEAEAIEDEAKRRAAIQKLADEGMFGTRRMYLGRSNDGSVSLGLHAADGALRARLVVEESGDARLEFLNENGEVERMIGAAE